MPSMIAIPCSALFANEIDRRDILALSDAVELRKPEQANKTSLPQLYHCELSLTSQWDNKVKKELSALAENVMLEAVSFHILSKYKENILINNIFHGRGVAYTRRELMENARENIAFVREMFGEKVPLLVENNNHLLTDAYDMVTDPLFIYEVVFSLGLYFLWDIAHSIITAHNLNMGVNDYIDALPLQRCIQVHLSGYGIENGFYFDAHDPLSEEDWNFFKNVIPLIPNVKYLTIEYYKDKDGLLAQLKKLCSIAHQMEN